MCFPIKLNSILLDVYVPFRQMITSACIGSNVNLKSHPLTKHAIHRKVRQIAKALFIIVSLFSDHFEGYIWEHPIELKKLLTGDLAKEMTVQVRRNCDAPFKTLTHQDCDPNFDQVN
jgi:hypothetical protein